MSESSVPTGKSSSQAISIEDDDDGDGDDDIVNNSNNSNNANNSNNSKNGNNANNAINIINDNELVDLTGDDDGGGGGGGGDGGFGGDGGDWAGNPNDPSYSGDPSDPGVPSDSSDTSDPNTEQSTHKSTGPTSGDKETVAKPMKRKTMNEMPPTSPMNPRPDSQFYPFYLYAPSNRGSGASGTSPVHRTLRQLLGFDAPPPTPTPLKKPTTCTQASTNATRKHFQYLIISNYLIDFTYFLQQTLPEILQFQRVIVFYGEAVDGEEGMDAWRSLLGGNGGNCNRDRSGGRNGNSEGKSVEFIRLVPSDPPRSRNNPLPVKIPYGVHHTKLFLVGYEQYEQRENSLNSTNSSNGSNTSQRSMIRVVVHTANLLQGDIECKTQGAYVQDFPSKCHPSHTRHPASLSKSNTVIDVADNNDGNGQNPYKRRRNETGNQDNRGWPFVDDDPRPFEDDLVTYLESYCYRTRHSWGVPDNKPISLLELIRKYDYSEAFAVLIPSIPGRHSVSDASGGNGGNLGYLKLRKTIIDYVCTPNNSDNSESSENSDNQPGNSSSKTVAKKQKQHKLDKLEQHCPPSHSSTSPETNHSHRPPLICQFSSIGSLTPKWIHQFLSALDSTSTHCNDPTSPTSEGALPKKGNKGSKGNSCNHSLELSSKMKLVWPTVEEIRNSVEGYRGGASVPGTKKNVTKEFLLPLFHRWSGGDGGGSRSDGRNGGGNGSNGSGGGGGDHDVLGAARHVPHIKTYVQPSQPSQPSSSSPSIEWMAVTSHNLSKAAWGELQNSSSSSSGPSVKHKVLFIRHWELGVFFSPATLQKGLGALGAIRGLGAIGGLGGSKSHETNETRHLPKKRKIRMVPFREGVHSNDIHGSSARVPNVQNVDLNSVKTLSIPELKRVLMERGIDFSDCIEKQDLIDRVLSVLPHSASLAPVAPVASAEESDEGNRCDEANDCEDCMGIAVPLPFSINPSRYNHQDVPWTVDGSHPLPDAFGRFGCC